MKKAILLSLTIIPMLFSCNNNNHGFVNPFPDDDYHPIALNFASNELIVRDLLSSEKEAVRSAYENRIEFDNNVFGVTIEIQERNYERAFAGEYKQGFNISNSKSHELYAIHRQEHKTENESGISIAKKRLKIEKDYDSVFDYSYGRNIDKGHTFEYHYFANKKENTDTYVEDENGVEHQNIISQTLNENKEQLSGIKLATKNPTTSINNDVWEDSIKKDFSLTTLQSEFYIDYEKCSSLPGADNDGNIILIKQNTQLYNGDGVYQLQDGRKFDAIENSIVVTKLKEIKPEKEGDKPWFLVSYAREYNDVRITSEEIQENIPHTMLANPIIVKYKESKYHYENEKTDIFEPIPEIEIKEEK